MSDIVSLISINPRVPLQTTINDTTIRLLTPEFKKSADPEEPRSACNFSALWWRLQTDDPAEAIILLAPAEDGYPTSVMFMPLADGDDQPAHIKFEDEFRVDFEAALRAAVQSSEFHRVLLIGEPAYSYAFDAGEEGLLQSVKPISGPEQRYRDFPLVGPLTIKALLARHDDDRLRERIIYVIEEPL